MSYMPLVSVVIATRNRCNEIGKTLASVRAQTYKNIEIIIVDDASTDGTRQYLQGMQDIILITNEMHLDLSASLRIGCERAQGKYIARIDDHDLWIDPAKLAKQVSVLENNLALAVVGSAYTLNDQVVQNPLSDHDIKRPMLFRCPFCHVTVLIRKEYYLSVGGYDKSLHYSEDWDLWLRLGSKYQLENLPDVTTWVKPSGGQAKSAQFFVKQWDINWKLVVKNHKNYSHYWLALGYHLFVRIFFIIFSPGSLVHRFFQKIFELIFKLRS